MDEAEEMLAVIQEAKDHKKQSEYNTLHLCTVCKEYSMSYVDQDYEIHELDCMPEHWDHVVQNSYDVTTLTGFEKGVRWALSNAETESIK